MIKRKILIILLLCWSITLAACGQVETKVKVVGENGEPIAGAEVEIHYVNFERAKIKSLTTDENGKIQDKGKADLRLKVYVSKDGYYRSITGGLERDKNHNLRMILRKKMNPIPLFARKFRSKVPVLGKTCAFDFEVSDWVIPYGSGKNKDMLIHVVEVASVSGQLGGKLHISFPGEGEGIMKVSPENGFLNGSEMRMPHLAAKNLYDSELERIEYDHHNSNLDWESGYFIKIREVKEEDGSNKYNYVKVQRDFKFHMGGGKYIKEEWRDENPDEYGFIEFSYWFNPKINDRNLEFDSDRNLFKDLSREERVADP